MRIAVRFVSSGFGAQTMLMCGEGEQLLSGLSALPVKHTDDYINKVGKNNYELMPYVEFLISFPRSITEFDSSARKS